MPRKMEFRFEGPLFLLATLVGPDAARATFHFMQIEQVMTGVDGDVAAQAIQLRMRSNGQDLVDRARLLAWDANGDNPVLLLDIPAPVASGDFGDRVLIATQSMTQYTNPPVEPDFFLAERIPDSYLLAGSLTFENDDGTLVVWRISWGGASYTGPTTGALTNDGDGEFGPAYPAPLRTADLQAIAFTGPPGANSENNLQDYVLTDGPAVLTNNAGHSFTVSEFRCPDDGDEDFDGDRLCSDTDNCPMTANAEQTDADNDQAGDACDDCPNDSAKVEPGVCGCGEADADDDGDGVIECLDNCPSTSNADQSDANNDGTGDACDTSDGDDDPDDPFGDEDDDANGGGQSITISPCGAGVLPVLIPACLLLPLRGRSTVRRRYLHRRARRE